MAKPKIKPTSIAKKPKRKHKKDNDSLATVNREDFQEEKRLQKTYDEVKECGKNKSEHVLDWNKQEGYHIHLKSLFVTKTFWASVSLFMMSVLGVAATALTNFVANPYFYPVIGGLFAVFFVILRMSTNNPVTPSINTPDPSNWFKKK